MSDDITRRGLLVVGAGALGAWLAGCGSRSKAGRPDAAPTAAPSPSPTAARPGGGYIIGYESERATDQAPARAPTPECHETEDNIEGPYYKPGAPERSLLVKPGQAGTRLTLAGHVLGAAASCGAIAGAEVDLWHADAAGGYDNQGYGFRGKVHTGADGKFQFDTIIPGRYLNGPQYRPAHIHVKVRDKSGSLLLTTQLYFDGDPYNEVDPFIKASLIMKPQGGVASYDLVVG